MNSEKLIHSLIEYRLPNTSTEFQLSVVRKFSQQLATLGTLRVTAVAQWQLKSHPVHSSAKLKSFSRVIS